MGMTPGGLCAFLGRGAGLILPLETPPLVNAAPTDMLTEEAALVAPHGCDLRLDMDVTEGQMVAEGAPLARVRNAGGICLVAPMACRVARISLLPGRRLGEIVLFREASGDVVRHAMGVEEGSGDALAEALQEAGFWPRLRRRPYGTMPSAAERPAAIIVSGRDTRPFAPDPRHETAGREEALARGLAALSWLTEGPVFLLQDPARPLLPGKQAGPRITSVPVGPRHPQGLAGIHMHRLCPATDARPVWDIHAGDVADIGTFLASGSLPHRRVISVAGAALTESRLLRCQIGADTRGLCYGAVRPGPHGILAGAPLDGLPAHWLGPRDRQVSVLPDPPARAAPHWFLSALTRSSRPRPIIPTAALYQATGGAFPAMAMLRALSAGDDETATRLGALSLLEEDLALVDYVLGGSPKLTELLRAFLDRAKAEAVP